MSGQSSDPRQARPGGEDSGTTGRTELLEAARAGAPGAWERIVDRFGALVLAVPRRMGLPEADCEEVFQVTWMTMHQRLQWIRKPESIPSWLITLASREASRLRRADRRRVDVSLGAAGHGEPPRVELPHEPIERLERVQRVRDEIGHLPEHCRRLLSALYLDPASPSYGQVAESLGIPLGSIGPTRQRCLARLAERLSADEPWL